MSTPGIELPILRLVGKRSPHCAIYVPDISKGTFSYLAQVPRNTRFSKFSGSQPLWFICSVRFLFAAFRLFAVYIFYLQYTSFICNARFYLQRTFFICSVPFLFAAYFFYLQRTFFICSVLFLFAAYFFYLQCTFFICSVPFFVCSVSFLFVAFLFCLQRFFFVCSVSFLFAACPLWAIVLHYSGFSWTSFGKIF